MRHVLLLSESIGTGHERAASAIEEALLAADPHVRVTRLNLLDTFRPRTAKVTRGLYVQALARTPKLWGRWYEWQRGKQWNGLSRLVVHHVLNKDVGAYVRHLAPDAVVCTHPLPACLIAQLKSEGLDTRLCTVVTDYDLHGYWVHPHTDLYCVPLPQMREEIRVRQGHEADVEVTGIPISPRFPEQLRETWLQPPLVRVGGKISLFEKSSCPKRVLISGGGLGVGVLPMVREIAESASFRAGEIEITVVCGRNRDLYRELCGVYGNTRRLRVLGYTHQMHRLMAEHDLLVTKPGGMTVSEALAMRLPMVLYTPIQGQEHRNGQLMQERGVAYIASDPQEGVRLVHNLLRHDGERLRMIRNMDGLCHPRAALFVADAVLVRSDSPVKNLVKIQAL
ncbi:MAG TPA: glycosyltransferase [Bacilli bacterium]|nr:glycosyltransferase [Bacilli bacterium]